MSRARAADALVFDLDGTLWDTCGACATAWNRVLARLGIGFREIVAADVRAVAGRPHAEGIAHVFGERSADEIAAIAAATAEEDNREIAARGGDLYPGVLELVPRLAARLPLAIVSNCQRGYVEIFLATSGLGACFRDFECWGNTGASKADNVRALMHRNGFTAPWLVGDTEGDREAAKDAGLHFVHARYGFGRVVEPGDAIERFTDLGLLIGI
jgi:phosphoglycolate phosphatase